MLITSKFRKLLKVFILAFILTFADNYFAKDLHINHKFITQKQCDKNICKGDKLLKNKSKHIKAQKDEFFQSKLGTIQEDEAIIEFNDLPDPKLLILNNQKGKDDPFSFYNDDSIEGFGFIKLLGIFSTKEQRYAIVKYKEKTGELYEGQKGGDDSLLPQNAFLKKVNFKESNVIINLNNKDYKIYLNN